MLVSITKWEVVAMLTDIDNKTEEQKNVHTKFNIFWTTSNTVNV